uniref:protein LAS1 isoform X2 n=1 Tax=Fragaria vesca subsp. vesca TaxID=101020 RepID=UPI0005C90B5C|nr:PREDICTED: protein LAS1 isoform X2 [Fragaria vesca subsp. vesca]
MESILGFMEEEDPVETSSSSSPYSHKLVAWLSWDEWLFVSQALFSDSPDSVASALRRISAWKSRGCVPAVIEVTASIIEIHQKDPQFRKDHSDDAVDNCRADQCTDSELSEEMLAMLYCMTIMRLVNCVVEKTRKKNEISIAEAADAIGIPRSLIDIRHEGSHRELPALEVVRSASMKALDWLKYYYWEPQKNAIPFQGTGNANIRNEIKSKFHELAFCLRAKMTRSSQVKEKHGYKKDVTKIVKGLVGLYSSFSSEVVSVLLELLLNTKSSSDSLDLPENTRKDPSIYTSLNEWKLVITKFSNKKPELRLALLNAVLDMIETQEEMMGRGLNTSSDCGAKIYQVEHLSSLFTWLVRSFKGLKPPEEDSADEVKVSSAEKTISKAVLMDVLRKCLLVSASANNHLMKSALHLAKLTGDEYLVQKLNKLSFLVSSNLDAAKENTCLASSNSIFVQQEKSISQAAKKLELIKRHQMKREAVKGTRDADVGSSKRWVMAKSWTRCPIGMLPCAVGHSGSLPILDYNGASEQDPEVPGENEKWELNSCTGKKRANSDMQLFDNPCAKKMRGTVVDDYVSDMEDVLSSEEVNAMSSEDVCGHLMIGGVWKKVGEEEILAIKSAVRILV